QAPRVLRAYHGHGFHHRRLRDLPLDAARGFEEPGRDVRFEQARANGIRERDPRSESKDLRANLRGEPGDGSVRAIAARFGERGGVRGRREVLQTSWLRAVGNHSRRVEKYDLR